MTNSPIPGDVVARPTPKEAAENLRGHARKRNLWPGDNDFDDAAAIIDRQSDLIEALQRELAEAKANVDAATEVQNDATRALLAAESQASSARRLALDALEPFANELDGSERAMAGKKPPTFGELDALIQRARAAIRDIKGADSRALPDQQVKL